MTKEQAEFSAWKQGYNEVFNGESCYLIATAEITIARQTITLKEFHAEYMNGRKQAAKENR